MSTVAVVGFYIAVAMLSAVIVGATSGWLAWLDHHRVPRALLVAGSASGATLGLAVAVAALMV